MTSQGRDAFLGALIILKNILIFCLIGFLIVKTGHWWSLFLMVGLSTFKTTDNKEK